MSAVISGVFLSIGIGLRRRCNWARRSALVLCLAGVLAGVALVARMGVACFEIARILASWPETLGSGSFEGQLRTVMIVGMSAGVLFAFSWIWVLLRAWGYLRSDEAKKICRDGSS